MQENLTHTYKKNVKKTKLNKKKAYSKARISFLWENRNAIFKPSKKKNNCNLIDEVQRSHNYKMCNFSSLIYFGKVQSDSLRDVKPINNISDYVRT